MENETLVFPNETEARLTRMEESIKHIEQMLDVPDFKNWKEISDNKIKQITYAVCKRFNISFDQLISRRKFETINRPRQIAMWLCRKYTDAGFRELAFFFNRKDHCTVLHGVRVIDKLIETDRKWRGIIEELRAICETQEGKEPNATP